jgi:hypothetical protein
MLDGLLCRLLRGAFRRIFLRPWEAFELVLSGPRGDLSRIHVTATQMARRLPGKRLGGTTGAGSLGPERNLRRRGVRFLSTDVHGSGIMSSGKRTRTLRVDDRVNPRLVDDTLVRMYETEMEMRARGPSALSPTERDQL